MRFVAGAGDSATDSEPTACSGCGATVGTSRYRLRRGADDDQLCLDPIQQSQY